MKHINEIHLDGETPWHKQFNICTHYFKLFLDESLSEEERHKNYDLYCEERFKLESGYFKY